MAALAVGPFLYRSLLPESEVPPTGCSFVLVVAGLLALLVGATIWQLRRGRQGREPELDRRLWETLMGDESGAEPGDDEPSDPAGRLSDDGPDR